MIDIHSHVIFGVDDGASNIHESMEIINEMIENGVTDLICTPHLRKGMFESDYSLIKTNYQLILDKIKEKKLNINLYLGREVYYNKEIYNSLSEININDKKIVLLEFSYTINPDIIEVLYNFNRLGFSVIIAHIERYNYLSVNDITNLKNKNVFIQINAATVMGKSGLKEKLKAFKLIKAGVVDFIASDIHYKRNNYLKKSYNIISKKFGKKVADKLFIENALFIIE